MSMESDYPGKDRVGAKPSAAHCEPEQDNTVESVESTAAKLWYAYKTPQMERDGGHAYFTAEDVCSMIGLYAVALKAHGKNAIKVNLEG
ncbi:MAG: hypothetical protein IJB53_09900 [Mailhella sp.]|nr:hypothetical protein [Mailhella sp.]